MANDEAVTGSQFSRRSQTTGELWGGCEGDALESAADYIESKPRDRPRDF
ncbi:MAG: hypothetical protein ACYSUY_09765 [Planctomycetota bacterium]